MSETGTVARIKIWQSNVRGADWYYRLRQRPGLQIVFVLLAVVLIAAVFAPVISPQDPAAQDLYGKNQWMSADHWFGTDYLGRDLFSRVVCGLQTSMAIAVTTIVITFVIGTAIGSYAGYKGGWVDNVIARVIDVFLAFPSIILALALVTLLGSGILNMIFMLSIVQWASFARLMRGQVLAEKNAEYVLSARAAGLPGWWILLKHLMPNCIMPVVVLATMDLGHTILTISTLSFLGLGLPPSIPEWGSMINAGLDSMRTAPLNVIVPGLAITTVTLLFNLAGEGVRDITDPGTDAEGSL
ncbi:MAG: ABC transporter permease [Methanocorpusculum sp.]|uniref:ABC transporter permease n=1 Tax=Methanocorpusculum petauri TaxID=3002863 RepID=A0ABT4IHC4_9EURY|nr:ABC transporter permease [Methanocorpusculum petauri]MCZ9313530.1 ABC transporter permease [Methanocorpusculum sp.]MCZ0860956.1 ABC transporter permease [Methanocorpusculum petauri]MDE2443766.1 ABC transporter permease [Methanocorpusculum sp.]MDE2519032.1 ABC transporter permease [Methanocorpusculum sp.]MDE2523031.1 ABC transporter permease [Methanocorpusculum sp.]